MEHDLFILKKADGFKLKLPFETLERIIDRNATDDELHKFYALHSEAGDQSEGWMGCERSKVSIGFDGEGVVIGALEAIQILGPHRRHVYV